jgi:hypothetical protein
MENFSKKRGAFYAFLDENIKKNEIGGFDFSKTKDIDAKKMFEMFFEFDYSARRLCGVISELENKLKNEN